ncbi:transglutaminase family protein [Paraburkholderia lycopersici]|uniref:Transglutaminase-like enzyme, putative cysteine protease n=1 Tax=Paraburkholderia lycopersici TaxID=416944 RepID=A0A1G6MVF1_9BURK|nr:transglutaminase family protein [Paraburkholderia lycopersici]SDC59533.1 Transglutaminase-like enzyme, putative cysteine protease [Paraburkholderia lycopersici]
MQLAIRHDTVYRYEAPVHYSIQQLRLSPLTTPTQIVTQWHIDAPGKLDAGRDAYGNAMMTLVLTRPHTEIRLRVRGEVETVALPDGRLSEGEGPVPMHHFTSPTRLTEADEALMEFAHSLAPLDDTAAVLQAAERIAERVRYESGVTDVTHTAADALALGRGVCQDHAHVMLAVCRARGVPARYVSGYIDPGDVPGMASHAWVDVWLDNGWVTVDVTHACFASEKYCRIAVGRDYDAAAPVRGSRVGGAGETLDVSVHVSTQQSQQ